MSYDVYLVDPLTKEPLHHFEVHHAAGGTYAVGGTTELWLNITYNYSSILRRVLTSAEKDTKGVQLLQGMRAADSLLLLDAALAQLSEEEPSSNYWECTDGNVRVALEHLRQFAHLYPEGVWEVT